MSDTNPVPFDELYAQRQWVRALALRLVRDPGAADDVEQQTWIAAIEHPPRRGSVRAWLGTVVRNKAWKLRRAGDRRVRHEEAALPREAGRRPEEVVAAAEAQRRVVDAVMGLDEPYRSTVLLRFFEDVPPSEIARRLGVPLDTVRTRLRRAVEMLRARLDGEFEDRRAWAVPILGLPLYREASQSAAPLVTATVGATVMTAKQIVAAVAILAALAAVAAVVANSDSVAAPSHRPPRGAETDPQSAGTRTPRRASEPSGDATDSATAPATPVPPVPEIDRALDLHGDVVTPEGTAIAGAALRSEPVVAIRSAATSRTTAADGRFAFRLEPGEVTNVEAAAPGRARFLVAGLQPGERVRIVLPAAVRLRVTVRGSDGAPAGNAALHLTQPTLPFATGPQMPAQDATTDAAGIAVFDSLLPGAAIRVDAWPADRDAPASATLTLPAADSASTTITLARGADLRGRVFDSRSGQGIAGASVALSTGIGANRAATTTDDGTFRIAGDDPKSSNWLRVTAPGFVAAAIEAKSDVFAEAALRAAVPVTARVVDPSGAPVPGARVTVAAPGFPAGPGDGVLAGDDGRVRLDGLSDDVRGTVIASFRGFAPTNVDLVPQPGAATRDLGDVRLVTGGEVSGTVQRSDGSFVARAVVVLQGGGGGSMRFADDLGRFRFRNVAPGACQVGAADAGLPSRFRPLQIAEGTPAVATLVIETRRDLAIESLDPDGHAVAGIEFVVQSTDQQTVKVVTGADGTAHTTVTGRANVRFLESKAGVLCEPAMRTLRPSQSRARFVATPAGRASGTIVGTDGAPLAGAQFDVRIGTRVAGRLWTDAQGRFDVLVPVAVPASVELVGARPEAGKALDDRVLGGRMELTAGNSDLTLRAVPVAAGGTLSVRVIAPDGTPVAGVRVTAHGPISHFDATSDADGRARFEGVPVRELQAFALASAGWQTSAPHWVTPGAAEVTLRLRAGSSVAGRVVDAEGRAVARVAVLVEDATGSERRNGQTDAEGRFRVEFPADVAAPLSVNVQRQSREGFQDAWLEDIAPGASGLEIVLE